MPELIQYRSVEATIRIRFGDDSSGVKQALKEVRVPENGILPRLRDFGSREMAKVIRVSVARDPHDVDNRPFIGVDETEEEVAIVRRQHDLDVSR